MICTKCGAILKDDAKFCSECGTKLEMKVRTCANCGAVLEEGTKFCAECGRPVNEPIIAGGQQEMDASNKSTVEKFLSWRDDNHERETKTANEPQGQEKVSPEGKTSHNRFEYFSVKDSGAFIKSYVKAPISTIEELILSGNRKFSAFLFILYVLISCAFYPLAASKICGELIGSYMEFLDESETVVQMIFCGLLGGVGTILFSSLLYFVTAKLQKARTGFLDAVIAAAGTSVIPALILLVGILLAFVLPTWSLAAFLLSQIFWWVLGMPAVLALLPNRDDPETDLANNGKLWLTYFAFLMISVIVGFILLFKIDSSIVDLESMLERSFEGFLGSLF